METTLSLAQAPLDSERCLFQSEVWKKKLATNYLLKNCGSVNLCRDNVWIHVAGWATVLQVSTSGCLSVSGNTDGGTTVSDTILESRNVCSLMSTCESALIALALNSDVFLVFLAEFLARLDDFGKPACIAHGLSGVIGVAASSVPVPRGWFGIECDIAAHQLTHTEHEVPRHPHVITTLDSKARTNLVFPLTRHHLGVDACNLDTCVQASFVVCICNWPSNGTVIAGTAIVWSLGSRVSDIRESKRSVPIFFDEGVLLLNAEPWRILRFLVEANLG